MHNIREIHVVCNTHWDREFRETFEITRRSLLDMMDTTIDLLEADPSYRSYTLDAHCILVEDYLEMRPERRDQIARLLQERRLFLGPWYTLPDSMNTCGEALVRNFLRARAVAADLGTECMKAGYSPNNWGQPSQMPQLFRGFDIDSALIYRGISLHESPSEFIWVGADGSEIFGHRFGKLARYNWYYLVFRPSTRGVEPTDKLHPLDGSKEKPFRVADGRSRATANFRLLEPHTNLDKERIVPALEAMLELEGPDSSTGLFLAMHGHDISVAHPQDTATVEHAARKLAGKCTIEISNLEDFVARLREEVEPEKAVRLHGERRMNLKEGFWTYLLPCTVSARTYLKIVNTETENALLGEAEPLSCIAAALGGEYPKAYLERAWRFLLGNHTHDANAGCAPDRVCADMEYRYRQAHDIACICTEDAAKYIARNLDGGAEGTVSLVVVNPYPEMRDDVLEVEIALPQTLAANELEILDPKGNICPHEIVSRRRDSLFVDNHWDVPTYTEVEVFMTRVQVADLPAAGYATLIVKPVSAAAPAKPSLLTGDNTLENEHVRVRVDADGSVNLLHKPTNRQYAGLNTYRDQGEVGNAWGHEPPTRDTVIESTGKTAELEVISSGALSATIRARTVLALPTHCPDDDHRADETAAVTIDTYYTLRAGDPRLFVRTEFDNCVRDHWLRVIFPTGIDTPVVHADTHFDIVERQIEHPDDTGWIERFRGTAPMHQMVDLHDGSAGLAVLTKGLFEYEVFDTPQREIALSLVRSFAIKLQVSEEKMEVLPDTGVQCPGPQRFEYAILAHRGDTVAGAALPQAQKFNNPPRAFQVMPGAGTLPPSFSLVRIEGAGLVVTAIKQAESSNDLLVRLFNSSTEQSSGNVIFGAKVAKARSARLDETPEAELSTKDNAVTLKVPPKKIVTLLVTLSGP